MVYYEAPAAATFIDILKYANDVTGYMFGPALILAFFAVAFLSMKIFETEKALMAASFLTSIFTFLLLIIGIATFSHLVLVSMITAFTVFIQRYVRGGI